MALPYDTEGWGNHPPSDPPHAPPGRPGYAGPGGPGPLSHAAPEATYVYQPLQTVRAREARAARRRRVDELSTLADRAEADANMLALRREWAANEAGRTQDYPAWAAWARQQLAAASPTAADVIARGLPDEAKAWQLQERARRQADEARAERAVMETARDNH